MRIGIFTDSYLPYIGGVVRSIEIFTEELRRLGHEVNIYAPSYPGVAKEKDIFRFPAIPTPTYKGFYLAVPFAGGLERFLSVNRPDVIHVHSPFLLGRLGAKIARKLGVPLIFTFHTLYDQYTHYVPFARELSKGITRKICVDFCNRCDLVITPTENISRHIRSMGVTSPIKCLPTGIQLSEFADLDKNWLRQTFALEEQTILLSVGRAGKEKNISFLLDCFAQICRRHSNVTLILVGDGPELENLKSYAQNLGLTDKVIFTGKLAREKLVKVYGGADLFVFASMTETQGIVIAEAKAAGLPVVAVNAYGVSDMVVDGEDGYLVRPAIESFVNKVNFLIENKALRKKMGNQALLNAQALSSRKCAEKLVAYYESLLGTANSTLLKHKA
ncbi:glycosyltransferase family 4 protein [Desulforamulus hydrothermalis]|uniref:Glycosyl transferase group 1 n=1 Tax=Desulforamulus hydrothermalis Lam5 = DSM 18033 TaxID=1121428 RepID=K8DX62_9FIRM|nr:glycosyltransferase family 4 protein [Desulforamulus hydrothermalis]CCO07104.1 Glycosyl transferase group 1 [Desulforamulus hydrothermalis Lam5 = DSM 18033]SHG90081.1 1,2-diacylglycerol 3-glucosyltransferase [Desulforamulus hydrothermalis Lam5 = DSM 18033]